MTYNPFTSYAVTSGWNQVDADHSTPHKGIDYAMPVGTPLPASADGVLTNIPDNGTAGNMAKVTHADGTATVYDHVSQFTAPRSVKQGDVIAYSGGAAGAPGAGNSTGPHLHANDISADGTKLEPFTTGTGSGGSGNPITDALAGLLGPAKQITGTLTWWANRQNQIRVAYFGLGTTLLIIALVALFSQSNAGQTLIETSKQAASSAATAAKVALVAAP